MTRIVTTTYRYKRPKKAKLAAIIGPAIVTARKPGKRFADVPDLSAEELKRRGDAADALWRELVRRVREGA